MSNDRPNQDRPIGLGPLVGLPDNTSDDDYLNAVRAVAADVLFPGSDHPPMRLHDRGPEGDSLLHLACSWGEFRAVQLLAKAGVDVNGRDEMSETPLHVATGRRYLDIVQFLLRQGADPNIKSAFGYTPLEWARQMGFDEIVAAFDRS